MKSHVCQTARLGISYGRDLHGLVQGVTIKHLLSFSDRFPLRFKRYCVSSQIV